MIGKIILSMLFALVFPAIIVTNYLDDNFSSHISKLENFKPPAEHPRLFLRDRNTEDIKKNLSSDLGQKAFERIKNESVKIPYDSNYEETMKIIESNAFLYVLTKDDKYSKKAIQIAINHFPSVNFNKQDGYNSYVRSNKAGREILSIALVYDWCYDKLSIKEKDILRAEIKRIGEFTEFGYLPEINGAITGHSSEKVILRDFLAASVAIYDEEQALYNKIFKVLSEEIVPSRKFLYSSGDFYQGNDYGPVRFEADLYSSWIFSRMGIEIYNKEILKVPMTLIYSRRADGEILRSGDMFLPCYKKDGRYWSHQNTFFLAASYTKDPYMNYEFLKQYNKEEIDDVLLVTLMDSSIESKSPETLPLTKYYKGSTGKMIARTGWGKDSAVVEMKIGEYVFNNHAHLDSGSFQIFYKGDLAIDSGIYEGYTGGYGSLHDINYQKRTIAHNTLIIKGEQSDNRYYRKKIVNDGGQLWPKDAREPRMYKDVVGKEYKNAEVINGWFGPEKMVPKFSYIKGDLKKAYGKRVDKYNRAMVFINLENSNIPGALVVFDDVKLTKENYETNWLIHSIEKPSISNSEISINSEGNNQGVLYNTTLLPEKKDSDSKLVGGTGSEFLVNGKNYPNKRFVSRETLDYGKWRVEISNTKVSKERTFLNVVQVGDRGKEKLKVEKLENNHIVGAKIRNNIVVFGKTGTIKENISFRIPKNDDGISNNKILITDLETGKWSIRFDGESKDEYFEVVDGEGVYSFEKDSGVVYLEKII